MPVRRNLIAVGASAGGVEALMDLVNGLPPDVPAAVAVVVHLSPNHRSVLPRMIEKAGRLPARHARDGDIIRPGMIYVAPPDRHLIVQDAHLRLMQGPKENGARPAVDPLFRSAARALGPRVIGVVLSGALDDGTAGLHSIKRRGGLAIVQDPDEAIVGDMPRNAMANVPVDYALSAGEIGKLLPRLAREEVVMMQHPTLPPDEELRVGLGGVRPIGRGAPSQFSCPSCGGVLMEEHEGDVLLFRCQVGHAFGVESLRTEQEDALESALWAALRALEEKASLSRRMAVRARELKQVRSADRYDERAISAERQAQLVREALQHAQAEMVPIAAPPRKARAKRARKGTRS
jgi:two-component system chemotaxis response regulator CheB